MAHAAPQEDTETASAEQAQPARIPGSPLPMPTTPPPTTPSPPPAKPTPPTTAPSSTPADREEQIRKAWDEMNSHENDHEASDLILGTSPSQDPFSKPKKPQSEEERCDVFWAKLIKFEPGFASSDKHTECSEIDHAAERCLVRANNRAGYDHCNEHVSVAECESMYTKLAERYGTQNFPASVREKCKSTTLKTPPRSMYECVLAPDENVNGCVAPIMSTKK
ncbi:MAG TPA: hypothetical protein VL326_37205 [Kofleriaceae bacterium]|nr:hypothetical protein [Kofleriaceae bacterium]